MITVEDKFNRLLAAQKDAYTVSKLHNERAERVDLLDKFSGTEGFEIQIAMLEHEIAMIDESLAGGQKS